MASASPEAARLSAIEERIDVGLWVRPLISTTTYVWSKVVRDNLVIVGQFNQIFFS